MVGLDRKFWPTIPKNFLEECSRECHGQGTCLGPSSPLNDEPFGALDDLTRKSMQLLYLTSGPRLKKPSSWSPTPFLRPVSCQTGGRPFSQTSRIARIISIPLDRPRDRSMTETKAFARICGMVRRGIRVRRGLRKMPPLKINQLYIADCECGLGNLG